MQEPKRPLSAYNLWRSAYREQFGAGNDNARSTEMLDIWRNIEDRSVWEEKAAEAKEQYIKDLKSYIAYKMKKIKMDDIRPRVPRRPTMSAYKLWLKSFRTEIEAVNPRLTGDEILQKAEILWRGMKNTSRMVWEKRAAEAKKQYTNDLETCIDFMKGKLKLRRPSSTFLLWFSSCRKQIEADNPALTDNKILQKAEEIWREMKDRSVWEAKAAEAKERYIRASEFYIRNVITPNFWKCSKTNPLIDTPKRPFSPFRLWVNSGVQKQIKADNHGITKAEIWQKARIIWKGMKDKSVWEQKYAEAMEQYFRDLGDYLDNIRWDNEQSSSTKAGGGSSKNSKKERNTKENNPERAETREAHSSTDAESPGSEPIASEGSGGSESEGQSSSWCKRRRPTYDPDWRNKKSKSDKRTSSSSRHKSSSSDHKNSRHKSPSEHSSSSLRFTLKRLRVPSEDSDATGGGAGGGGSRGNNDNNEKNHNENKLETAETTGQSADSRDKSTPNCSGGKRHTPTPNRCDGERYTLTPTCLNAERDMPTQTRLDGERDTPTPNNRRSNPEKISSLEDPNEDINDHIKRAKIPKNRFEVFGEHIGMKLQHLQEEQGILAENIINQALFLAEMGRLTMTHSVRNVEFISTAHSNQPHTQTITSKPYIQVQNSSTQPGMQFFLNQPLTQGFSTQPNTQSQSLLQPDQHIGFQEHDQVQNEDSTRLPLQSDETNESEDTAASYLNRFID